MNPTKDISMCSANRENSNTVQGAAAMENISDDVKRAAFPDPGMIGK